MPPLLDSPEHTWASKASVLLDVSDDEEDGSFGEGRVEGADNENGSALLKPSIKENRRNTTSRFSRGSRASVSGSKTRRLRSSRSDSALAYNEKLQRTELCFRDLSVKIEKPSKGGREYLLHGMTGHIQAGEIVALMGPSRAGKTTLLESLLGKALPGLHVSGSVNAASRRNNGYVAQTDVLPSCSTVSELLHFHCAMKLPTSTTLVHKLRARSCARSCARIAGWRLARTTLISL